MDTLLEMLTTRAGHLVDRLSGPLNFRLMVMPLVVSTLAIRAGLRDAREGGPQFLWTILTNAGERPRLLRSALKDIGKIFVVAIVLDTTYQLMVLRAFYVGELLFVALVSAIVPYLVIRGPVTLLARGFLKNRATRANSASAEPTESAQGPSED